MNQAWRFLALLIALTGVFVLSGVDARADALSHPSRHGCHGPCPSNRTPAADPAAPSPQATDVPPQTDPPTPAATPVPPTPTLKDSGFAESGAVSQGQSGTQISAAAAPINPANYASAPGFASVGIPAILIFAVLGIGAYTVRKRL